MLESLLLAAMAVSQGEAPAPAVTFKEWRVPWSQTRPRDPSVAPDGKVWFVGQAGDYAAVFNPVTAEFRRIDLPDGAGPHTVLVDGFGRPWYTGNADAHIGRIDPVSGSIKEFPTPTSNARDPHTLTFARDGGLWFTSQNSNGIGRLDTASGQVQMVPVPTSNAKPYGILTAPDGSIWAVLFGTYKLARIDPATRRLEEFNIPRTAARPRRIGVTSDGAIWYGDYAAGYLGRYIPSARQFKEWRLPGAANARPYAMTVDDLDRVWVVETGRSPNQFVGFDPRTERFESFPVPSGGGTIRHMVFHKPTRAIWYGSDVGMLGSAAVNGTPSTALLPARPALRAGAVDAWFTLTGVWMPAGLSVSGAAAGNYFRLPDR